jgi:hypothetical protein
MALYLKEVALLETTTNTLVKLTNVMEGVENGAVFGYQTELISIKVNANQTEQVVTRHTFDIVVKDDATPATQAILTAWANNPELRFKASGYSGDTFFLWDEPVPIVFSRQYDLIGARHLIMTLDAVSGYNGASGSKKLPVYAGQNIMMLLNQFLGSSTNFSGWSGTMSGGGSTAFSDGATTITLGAGSGTLVSANYFFPFDGVILTGAIRGGGGGSIGAGSKITVSFLNSSEVEISETSGGTLSLSTGTYFNSGLTATGTYYIRLKLFFGSGGAGATVVRQPVLRLGYGESNFAN